MELWPTYGLLLRLLPLLSDHIHRVDYFVSVGGLHGTWGKKKRSNGFFNRPLAQSCAGCCCHWWQLVAFLDGKKSQSFLGKYYLGGGLSILSRIVRLMSFTGLTWFTSGLSFAGHVSLPHDLFSAGRTVTGMSNCSHLYVSQDRIHIQPEDEQTLRRLTFKCQITKKIFLKIVLVVSLKEIPVTQSILCLIFLMCVETMHH